MNTPQIETGIPLPSNIRNRYPFDDMNSGDSFVIEGGTAKHRQSVRACAARRGYKIALDWVRDEKGDKALNEDGKPVGVRVHLLGKA